MKTLTATGRTRKNRANAALHALGLTYHQSIPLVDIDNILAANGFLETEEAIYCGRDGRSQQPVAETVWLILTWHKMDSGTYEILAYLS
jgi:hypothetical protein